MYIFQSSAINTFLWYDILQNFISSLINKNTCIIDTTHHKVHRNIHNAVYHKAFFIYLPFFLNPMDVSPLTEKMVVQHSKICNITLSFHIMPPWPQTLQRRRSFMKRQKYVKMSYPPLSSLHFLCPFSISFFVWVFYEAFILLIKNQDSQWSYTQKQWSRNLQ